ncbi:MAG: UDP-N-acetylmuramate--L-alanine ligase, partial [Bacteroidota bacterium]
MMTFGNIRSVYFLGAGGIGMSALARFFMAQGKHVGGYDKTPTSLTDELIGEGMDIHFEDDISKVESIFKNKSETLVILTPAIPKGHSEWEFFKSNGFEIMKRSQVLGLITQDNYTVAVAGTHGKTTTSSLIAHILRHANIPCTAFLGGISKNYGTNLLIGTAYNGRHIMVVEADEYDRSFLTLFPDLAVITSMDPDHLDIYGTPTEMQETYRSFACQVKPTGLLIHRAGLDVGKPNSRITDYSLRGPSKQHATNILVKDHRYIFDWTDGVITYKGLTTGLPGEHNVENAVAAVTVTRSLGLSEEAIRQGLSSYAGVKRRFDYQVQSPEAVFIDDYAHH